MDDEKKLEHRLRAASASLQKGIYHLFLLKEDNFADSFDYVLRIYQSIFLLNITQMLLDFNSVNINSKNLGKKDPAAGIQHKDIKSWDGFPTTHPLSKVSKDTLNIFDRIINARHNIIYRPYYLDTDGGWYWEDCTLKDLLQNIPSVGEIESAYKTFFNGMEEWEEDASLEDKKWIPFFKFLVFQKFNNSSESLLVNYIKLLNPNNDKVIEKVKKYCLELFGEEIKELF